MKTYNEYLKSTLSKKDIEIMNITNQLLFPTGFMYHDYFNGNNLVVYDEYERPLEKVHNVGLVQGSINSLVSKSNVGKTTFGLAMAKGIITPWLFNPIITNYILPEHNKGSNAINPGGLIQVIDSEGSLDLHNVKRITKFPNKILRDVFQIYEITTDTALIEVLKRHVQYKEKYMRKVYMPVRDIYGDYILSYPPTILFVDSINKINPEPEKELVELKEYEKATGNTAGARRARIMSTLVSIEAEMAKKYNIIIIHIQHMNIAPNMSVLPPSKQLPGLPPQFTLAGGERAVYLTANIWELKIIKTIGGEKSGSLSFGTDNNGDEVTGSVVSCRTVKSKTNKINNTSHMIYTDSNGYDPLLSTFYHATQCGDIASSGNSYVLDEYPNIKLNVRNVYDKLSDEKLLRAFYNQIRDKAERVLSNPDEIRKQLARDKQRFIDNAKEEGNFSDLDNLYNEL